MRGTFPGATYSLPDMHSTCLPWAVVPCARAVRRAGSHLVPMRYCRASNPAPRWENSSCATPPTHTHCPECCVNESHTSEKQNWPPNPPELEPLAHRPMICTTHFVALLFLCFLSRTSAQGMGLGLVLLTALLPGADLTWNR